MVGGGGARGSGAVADEVLKVWGFFVWVDNAEPEVLWRKGAGKSVN